MIKYTYDAQKNIINCQVPKVLTAEMAIDYFRRLHDDDTIQQSAVERAHFLDLREAQISEEGVEQMREEYERMAKKRDLAGTVFIVNNDYGQGIARLFQGMFSSTIRFNSSIERME